MLDLPRYLLGVLEVVLLGGFATFGATAVRSRLLPSFNGAPAHLATSVVALALLIWLAEILGSFGLFEPLPYVVGIVVVGSGLRLSLGGDTGGPSSAAASRFSPGPLGERDKLRGEKPSKQEGPPVSPPLAIALSIAVLSFLHFALDVKAKLSTGMTGFDSTWYHGPFAAGFFQGGDTWSLHFIAPQFLAWFYPANAEIFHGAGMLAFGRDLISPLLNLAWFVGCLGACWCIGRPYRVAPWSLALGAVALSLPVLSDQAGEARNDIVGIFFLLAAVAIALNAYGTRENRQVGGEGSDPSGDRPGTEVGAAALVGLAAGLAAGTKLNFLLPAAVLVLGLPLLAPAGRRRRSLAVAALAALAGGGYWYLRNLIYSGNPLPWFDSLGPLSLPAPGQALGGREGHSVLGYLGDGAVWSDWFLPGLHGALTILWPLVAALAITALTLCFAQPHRDRVLTLAGLTGLAVIVAWLIAPTSASGPEGVPRGFESGLRYLAPALVLGLALLPATLSARLRGAGVGCPPAQRRPLFRPARALGRAQADQAKNPARRGTPHARPATLALLALLAAIAIRLPDPAPLPARPLRQPDRSPPPASTPPSSGQTESRTPASPPPAPASTPSSAPTSPTTSSTSAKPNPTAASPPPRPASNGAACSTGATTTT